MCVNTSFVAYGDTFPWEGKALKGGGLLRFYFGEADTEMIHPSIFILHESTGKKKAPR